MNKKALQLSVLLALAILFFLSLLPVFAARGDQKTLSNPTPTPTPFASLQEFRPVPLLPDAGALAAVRTDVFSEVVSLRTMTSKHYQLGPNLYQAHISAAPLHYRDSGGNWQDIDLHPVPRPEGGFGVEANNVRIIFPERLDGTGLQVDATIYPAPQIQPQLRASSEQKPDLATLNQGNSAIHRVTQKSPVELSLQWQPQYLTYYTENNQVSSLRVTDAQARSTQNSVEYVQAFENATVAFYPSASGFVQRLDFAAPPAANTAKTASRLDYVVHVTLPSETRLYSHGVPLTDNFVTNMLELRDEVDNQLLILQAPQLSDQAVSHTSARARYRIEHAPDGITLIAELPLDWLADSARQYPISVEFSVIFPMGLTSEPLPPFADTWIWQCAPGSLWGSDPVMWVGNLGCNGSGAERALAQWSATSLPQDAMIIDPTESQLWRLPGYDTGAGSETIDTHRMLAPWSYLYATWLTRTSTSRWTQPGAEEDHLAAAESTIEVPSGGSQSYINMGSLASLVGAWHTDDYFLPWGDANYGVMYKSTNESVPDSDRAFAQIGLSGGVAAPMLSVTYYTDTLFNIPPNTNFYLPRAPSPDYFRVESVPTWRAVGIRPLDGRSDYDLFLSSSANYNFSTVAAASFVVGSAPDFIVIRPDVSSSLFPWSIQWEGTGLYYLRYPTQSQELSIGGATSISDRAFTYTVLSVYGVDMIAGEEYEIALDVMSGDADLGLGLFPPAGTGGKQYMTRDDAAALSDSSTFGGGETIAYGPEVTGLYGLVVWNNGGTNPTDYELRLEQRGESVYVPIILKDYVPPAPDFANGGFETGTFYPWISAGPGSPMIASVVPNPSPGCFPGGLTAQLGTPGKLADNTIPVGEASFEQTFHVPTNASQLSFVYQAFSYDVIQGCNSGRYYDRFNVMINGAPVYMDGNSACSSDGQTLWQSGCQSRSIPIGSFAGQNITLKFSVYNLTYPSFNTWAYVDNVRIQ
jgi:hypothetical protein